MVTFDEDFTGWFIFTVLESHSKVKVTEGNKNSLDPCIKFELRSFIQFQRAAASSYRVVFLTVEHTDIEFVIELLCTLYS